MNEIVIRSTEGNPVTTSLLVADKFGKEHKNVLSAIREICSQLPESEHKLNFQPMFIPIKIGNGATRNNPYYIMTRDGFSLLVMGFTGTAALKFKLEFIAAFNEMERRLSSTLPSTYLEALKALVVSEEAKQLAENTVRRLEPKAKVYDQISNANGLLSMNEAAKSIKIGRNQMMAELRGMDILMDNNTPYQKFIDIGYFKVIVSPVEKAGFNVMVTKVTGKGLTWLAKKFDREN